MISVKEICHLIKQYMGGAALCIKFLVVDDEPKIREVIREYAEFSGYEVVEAEDGMAP